MSTVSPIGSSRSLNEPAAAVPTVRAIVSIRSRSRNRGRRNAAQVQLRTSRIVSARLAGAFNGFRILHLTDLHADMSRRAIVRVAELTAGLDYDFCVLTGHYRGKTIGRY